MFPRMSQKEAMKDILKTLMDKSKMTTATDFKKVKTEFLKHPSNTITKFNYGVALIHSKDKENKEEGLAVLTALIGSLDEQHSKLCLYHLCFGCFSLEKFALVKQYGEQLLAAGTADDLEAQKLKALLTLSEEFIQNPSLWHVLDKKKGAKKGKEGRTKKPIQKKLSFMEKLMSFVDSSGNDDKENINNFGSSSDIRSSENERWNEVGRLYRSDTILYEKELNVEKEFLSEEQTRKRTYTRTSMQPLEKSNKRFKATESRVDFGTETSEGMNAILGGLKSRASGSQPQVDVKGLQQTFEHLQTMYEDVFPSESPGEDLPPPNPLHLQPPPSAIDIATLSSSSILDRALLTNKPLPEPKCEAVYVSPPALPSTACRKLFSPKPWVIIRRYGMRGGKKIRLPNSLETLLAIGSSAFRVQIVAVREATTEAQIEELECITGECVLWMMTAEDEKLFS